LDKPRLERIVRTYADHIAMPIRLAVGDGTPEAANSGTALWTRPKSDITDAQYAEFYRHVSGAFDAPAFTLHFRAEGRIEYTALLFVPEHAPFDLYDPARKSRVKLYVKRVFITDDCAELLPGYLRFLRGIVDSQDLPLNISREMLQNNPLVAAMRKAIVSRLLGDLAKFAAAEPAAYEKIWDIFGRVLKEGLYEDAERRQELLALARFKSTAQKGWVSLADYVGRMKAGQKAIYVIRGDDVEGLAKSPQLEGFRARGIEVLLLADPIDDFWVDAVGDYDGKPLRSVTRASSDLDDLGKPGADKPAPSDGALATLAAALKTALGDKVKDVRASARLTDSAVCLVADEGGLDLHLERMLRQHEKLAGASPRILEINPTHPLINALAARAGKAEATSALADAAHLLLDQAYILEGEGVADAGAFARRLNDLMARSLA
ncbi:MAG: molecular chaperone HtpG, partial [Alphaproteobacteria bacterium]